MLLTIIFVQIDSSIDFSSACAQIRVIAQVYLISGELLSFNCTSWVSDLLVGYHQCWADTPGRIQIIQWSILYTSLLNRPRACLSDHNLSSNLAQADVVFSVCAARSCGGGVVQSCGGYTWPAFSASCTLTPDGQGPVSGEILSLEKYLKFTINYCPFPCSRPQMDLSFLRNLSHCT